MSNESKEHQIDTFGLLCAGIGGGLVGLLAMLPAMMCVDGTTERIHRVNVDGTLYQDTRFTELGQDMLIGLTVGMALLFMFAYVAWVKVVSPWLVTYNTSSNKNLSVHEQQRNHYVYPNALLNN